MNTDKGITWDRIENTLYIMFFTFVILYMVWHAGRYYEYAQLTKLIY